MDEGEGVALAFALGQGIGGGDVELAVDQRSDEMVGEPGLDRIMPRLALLVVAGHGALHPVRRPRADVRGRARPVGHVGNRRAAIDQDAGHVVVVIELLVVVADDDQRIELRADQAVVQPAEGRHRAGVAFAELLRGKLGLQRRRCDRHQLIVGRGPSILVKQRAPPIDRLEQRPVLDGGIEHRRMRGSGAEDDASHGKGRLLPRRAVPDAREMAPLSFPLSSCFAR